MGVGETYIEYSAGNFRKEKFQLFGQWYSDDWKIAFITLRIKDSLIRYFAGGFFMNDKYIWGEGFWQKNDNIRNRFILRSEVKNNKGLVEPPPKPLEHRTC